MTVKELIAKLQEFDENLPVEIFDENHGYIDITEIFQSRATYLSGTVYDKVNIA